MPAKTREKAKAVVRKPRGRNPVKDSEIARAAKMAQRKNGVTKAQLAKALRVGVNRAGTILGRVPKIRSAAKGADAGKACRTLVYKLGK